MGRPRLIRGEDIKPGAVVIDAGYNPGNVGDVDFDTAPHAARLITPVPGGVGPMTIAVLLAQTVDAAVRPAHPLSAARPGGEARIDPRFASWPWHPCDAPPLQEAAARVRRPSVTAAATWPSWSKR